MMSSPPLTPPSKAHTTAATSKRLSLNVSIGPKPLHLLDANANAPSGPATAPLACTFSPPSSSRPNPRRQSSISYRSNTADLAPPRSPLSASAGLARSRSVGPLKPRTPISSPRDRRSAGFEANATQERPPLTLAEKHSELLHYIAQKEAKCLELRSQLATHEAELLQLKRKWERIVNRGFLDAAAPSTPHSPAANHNNSNNHNNAMLEGIREGVHGVGRFIAAGLSIGELSPSPTPHSHSTHPHAHPSPSPLLRSLSSSTSSSSTPLRQTHAPSPSASSVSTYATKSTRFSQSSASSIGEEPPPPQHNQYQYEDEETEDTGQILMVHDTGATPTMSPNPAFEQRRQQRERERDRETQSAAASRRSSFEAERDTFATAKGLRRRSRDAQTLLPPQLEYSCPDSYSRLYPAEEDTAERNVNVNVKKAREEQAADVRALDEQRKEAARAKRASLNGTGFPPVSSIPGFASLTVGAAAAPPVASWVGSVGKKWEELQRGSFSKSQKRASVLLADVSHSIVSALSSPSPSPAPPTPKTPASSSASLRSSPVPPSSYTFFGSSPALSRTASTSLLDDDDDSHGALAMPAIMTPDTKPASHAKPKPHPKPRPKSSPALVPVTVTTAQPQEDKDEWNW
ncbi:hypothetical protein H0H81_012264 [Sphagnurus paluster]|uniref:Uncharacterized protein n=1 Tax=Sphagnurus paluster TaxID=117069 RepID=A0A9P7GUC1_9AGAR|nr:hypothetical protein H0H81_012264 [Sphagnurus paluster]